MTIKLAKSNQSTAVRAVPVGGHPFWLNVHSEAVVKIGEYLFIQAIEEYEQTKQKHRCFRIGI